MARRRVEWLAAWHLEGRTVHPPARVRREVAQLETELLAVLAALHGLVDPGQVAALGLEGGTT